MPSQGLNLNELLERINSLAEEDRAGLRKQAIDATADMLWVPNPGPQTQAFFSEADETFYGGAAGGGKSSLLCGVAITAHHRSIIFRREYPQIKGLVDECSRILGSKDGYNAQDKVWKLPKDRELEFGSVQHEDDKEKYQGRAHDLKCVGRGTNVVMGDGSLKPIEKIRLGDFVQTLEGARRVSRLIPMRVDEAVRVTMYGHGAATAAQVQSRTHDLLTTAGWVSFDKSYAPHPVSICAPTEFGCDQLFAERKRPKSQALPISLGSRLLERLLTLGRALSRQIHRASREIFSCGAQVALESGFGSSSYLPSGAERHLSETGQTGHQQRPDALSLLGFPLRSLWHGATGERGASLLGDLTDRYSIGSGPCGEQPRLLVHLATAVAGDQAYLRQQFDAERPSPNGSQDGGLGGIHRRIHHTRTYAHPYTKETRQAAADLCECWFSWEPCGAVDLFDIEVEDANHYVTEGGFTNKNCFDEITHFTESQYRFLIGWARSTKAGQRVRVISAGNPPFSAEGVWVIKYWGPWLDPNHPNPAKPGELRWFTTIKGEDVEVDGPGPYIIENKPVLARSRTFIPSRLEDNPDLMESGYASVIEAMPEPLRTMMREGRFDVSQKDADYQVIPTSWVMEAQNRWTENGGSKFMMTAIGVDVAQGGPDKTTLAPRYGGWYAPIVSVKGEETPDGSSVASLVVKHRRGNAAIIVDVGGGYGGGAVERMNDNNMGAVPFNGTNRSTAKTKDNQLGFKNKRAEAWWKFREALDPDQEGGSAICLPPDPELRADLCAATWKLTPQGIQIEEKPEIKKRIGRSPDKGDAAVMALSEGDRAVMKQMRKNNSGERPTMANRGMESVKKMYK